MEKNEMQNSRIENEMQSSGMGKNVNQNSGISRRGEENAPYYLGMTLIYSVCFAFAFYRNYIGITFPLITAATLAACVLFLRKKRIPWKKSSWLYAAACLLLSISTHGQYFCHLFQYCGYSPADYGIHAAADV